MDLTAEATKLKNALETAKDVVIVTHERPTHDSIGSALALYLGLQELGKKVSIACPDPITVELSNYVGVDKIGTELAKKNFIISLDYIEGSIEKVSYNIEGDKFNLVIEPRPGHDTFSADKVHYTQEGSAADCIITVDTIHLGGLKKLYDADKELYAGKPLINIDRHPNNAMYGTINLVDSTAPSTSEVVAVVLSALGVTLSTDIATNILNAIYTSTNNFQHPSVNARTFELVARCMQSGGRRFGNRPATQEESPKGEMPPRGSNEPQQKGQVKPPETPADWLKPKVYKSSNLL